MLNIKDIFITITGVVGGFISYVFGGWTAAMTTLCIFMAIDYLSGLVVAGIFRKSNKTESGALSSKVGFKGLFKKLMVLVFVLISSRLDMTLGTSIIRDGVCIAFIANELISIIENAGLMGVPIPKMIKKALDMLQTKIGDEEAPKEETPATLDEIFSEDDTDDQIKIDDEPEGEDNDGKN